jgi:hypothetical protein
MKILERFSWNIKIAGLLIFTSMILYIVQTMIFREPKTELFYIGINLVFLPIEALIVVIIIQTGINEREKKLMLEKLNMVIGAFFSEVGTELLTEISKFDSKSTKTSKILIINSRWEDEDFEHAKKNINALAHSLLIVPSNTEVADFLYNTKLFLQDKRMFLLALIENPNLLEHESFTDLLRAVFHLTEELDKRKTTHDLPTSDCEHLKEDVQRVYDLLIFEWLNYMEHLKNNYRYLFSLAMRTNPFDPNKTVVIQNGGNNFNTK